jgi:hypothetical protein
MKWKLILLLSLFGLAMAFATVFWIPVKAEPAFWLVIFILCAYLIAKNCPERVFLHGFLVSMVNCFWITGIHAIYFHTYLANHPGMAQQMADWPMAGHPLRMMTLMGVVIGIVSGVVLGLFAVIAVKLVKKNNPL